MVNSIGRSQCTASYSTADVVKNPQSTTSLCFFQGATSVPKKRRSMKQLNKKEAIGHLLDAFTEVGLVYIYIHKSIYAN